MSAHKKSRKREAILQCVRGTNIHPTAEWVYAQLKSEIPALSLGTVYRNLAMFKREGVIASVGVVDGMERFDGNAADHVHFVCTHCNAMIDINDMPLPLMQKVQCGTVKSCSLIFYGVCNQCVQTDHVTTKNLEGEQV